jgi:hypothetical protein
MRQLFSGRRGFLKGVLGGTLAALTGKPAGADQTQAAAPSGVAATWSYRWHEGLRSTNPVPRPTVLPDDFVPAGDHQKHKTQHWVRPKDWPVGPAVQTQRGEIISIDFMIAKADFDRGFSWSLAVPEGLRGFKIDHVDIDLVPAGHSGFETAHYDMHLYFIPHSSHGACDV